MRIFFMAVSLAFAPLFVASAQARQGRSPYARQEGRVLKALSDETVQGYLDGRGMALALSAELNHYPGPRHVLDLADSLQLTAEQRAAIQTIYNEMHGRAVPLGRSLVAVESRLDSAFAQGTITPERLAALLHESATVTERLRLTHLRAHLDARRILSSQQIASYDRLRGYDGHSDRTHEGHMHGGAPHPPE